MSEKDPGAHPHRGSGNKNPPRRRGEEAPLPRAPADREPPTHKSGATTPNRGRGHHDLTIYVRRVRTDPAEKREQFIQRLDDAVEAIEAILDDPKTSELTRIKAANAIAWILRASYTIIRDIDVENLEHKLAILQAENQARKNAAPTRYDFSPLPESTEAKKDPKDTATESRP